MTSSNSNNTTNIETNYIVSKSSDRLSTTSKTEETMTNTSDVDEKEQEDGKENQEQNDGTPKASAINDNSNNDHPLKIGDYDMDYLIERATKKIDKRTSDWDVLNHSLDVPKLSIKEIEMGRFLGEGGFFKVHEIQKITLDKSAADDTSESEARELEELQDMTSRICSDDKGSGVGSALIVQDRRFMEKNCCRPSQSGGKLNCRYAIKMMKKGALSDPGLFVNTLVDMAIEAKFLSSLRHPNIIKMRGISTDFIAAGADSFIILDRLYQTLTERIASWKDKKENGFGFVFDFRGKKSKAFLAERLTVAFDVANALEYLHDRNIIYRDLKPDNLGFDVRGDVKLFDFGLATEFDKEKHGSYKLTGDTGTIRYMAPEVAMEQSYTEKADVYSFGILLWQIMSLETPYGKLHGGKIEYSVCHLGLRPKLDPSWPPSVLKLLEDCFARNPPRRPSMEVICTLLQREANSLADKKIRDEEWMDKSKTAQSERYFE
ncbi:serine/threonine protein kinase [Nitzschia inconspicua]|uniref:Serine/threonine protein kinase n=1 Tax=Nitzschia inconspicua TaxID=303405 RepID=A0A9K3PLI0_9STRA|nr:serine/threonine protein kinase [Nitzschia inconspicua]